MSNEVTNSGRPAIGDCEPTADLGRSGVEKISNDLRRLADVFALYLKTKNFHWHMSGRHFRDYQLLWTNRPNNLSP
jgi:DNA-binding ferritin-like protein